MLNKIKQNPILFDLILIFLFAFAIRLIFVFVIRPMAIGPIDPRALDPDKFGARAVHLLEGRGFIDVGAGEPEVGYDPFYSFLLAGVWALSGYSKTPIQIVNSLLGGLTAASTYLLAYYSFGRKVGWGAAILYSCFPLNIWYVPLYRYEVLSTFLIAVSGVFYLRLRNHLYWRDTILMGVTLGLAALTLSTILLLPVVLILVSLFGEAHKKQLVARVIIATLIMSAIIFPWSLRNYTITKGQIIPVREGGAYIFFYGNYAVAHYNEAPMQLTALREAALTELEAIILETTGAASIDEVDPVERAKIEKQLMVNFLKTQPDQFIWKIIVQSARFWYLGDTMPKSIFILSIQLPLLIMAILGIVQAVRQQKPFLFYLLIIAYFNFIYAVIWVEARYSVPIEPYVMTLAGYGLLSFKPIVTGIERLKFSAQSLKSIFWRATN